MVWLRWFMIRSLLLKREWKYWRTQTPCTHTHASLCESRYIHLKSFKIFVISKVVYLLLLFSMNAGSYYRFFFLWHFYHCNLKKNNTFFWKPDIINSKFRKHFNIRSCLFVKQTPCNSWWINYNIRGDNCDLKARKMCGSFYVLVYEKELGHKLFLMSSSLR